MDGHVSAHASGMQDLYGSNHADPPVRRGPGRPLGSTNKPKPPPLSPMQREALKAELGPAYVEAVLTRMRAEMRANGLKSLIVSKLGREDLAAIEADVIVEAETKRQTDETDDGNPKREAA